MPGKSEYIEAPFTLDRITQALKDAFEFVGYEVNQTSDTSAAFDSEYWRAKQTSSTKNLLPESEQLTQGYHDYVDFSHTYNGVSSASGPGSEAYIKENTDVTLPFKLINVVEPRAGSKDVQMSWSMNGLKPNTSYTVSFWARKPETNPYNPNMVIVAGKDRSNPGTYKGDAPHSVGSLTTQFQRFYYTFNTGSNTSLHSWIGGYSSWATEPLSTKNLLSYTEEMNYWSGRGVSRNQITDQSLTGVVGYESNYKWSISFGYHYEGAVIYFATQNSGTSMGGKTYTYSVYAKVISGAPYINFNGTSERVTLDSPGVWKRYSITATMPLDIGNYVNCHVWGTEGDSVILWGHQMEESPVMTSYSPVREPFTGTPPAMFGDLEHGGWQLEEGTSPSAYEPVRKWHFKPYPQGPKILNTTLQNEIMQVYYHRPAGIEHSFISCSSSTDFYGQFVPTSATYHSAPNMIYKTFDRLGSEYAVQAKDGLAYSGGGLRTFLGGSYALNILSTGLRGVFGTNENNTGATPYGNVYFSVMPPYSPIEYNGSNSSAYQTIQAEAKMYGVLFKLSTKSEYAGTKNVRGLCLHQKTPGDGRRKFTSIFLREYDTSISISLVTPTVNYNSGSISELEGYLIPTISPKFTYTATGTRGSGPGWGENAYMGLPWTKDIHKTVSLMKNNDTFSFVQGAADGFVWALNVNSNFVFKYSQADLVNSPNPLDDGSVYSRFAVGGAAVDNDSGSQTRSMDWHAHGPTLRDNYGMGFGNHYRMWSYYQGIPAVSNFPEIYGDYTGDVDKDNSIYQMYCVFASDWVVSSRGQLKNMFYMKSLAFSGLEGDSVLALDGTRYFALTKTLGSPNTASQKSLTHLVKV